MWWPQTRSPAQTENSAAAGVVNNAIVPRKLKMTDRRLHWMRCREAQDQFQYYWASGSLKWGDCINKYHPPLYHEAKRMQFAGLPVSI